MRSLSRAAECSADDITATLEDEEDGITVRCVVRHAPLYGQGRVVLLPNSPDGATHLEADNVECFVTGHDRDRRIADVPMALALMHQRSS